MKFLSKRGSARILAGCIAMLALLTAAQSTTGRAKTPPPTFKVVALAEPASIHKPFVDAAKVWLDKLAAERGFSVDYIQNTEKINDAFLAQYRLFIQLDYPPYTWTPTAAAAFTKYIEEGKGGWIGFHHATLLGEFDGYPMWPWYWQFMGKIRFKDYIATFATAEVTVEDPKHPVMAGVPEKFTIDREEWYTYDASPRSNVHVLAHVNEASYSPDSEKKMGDHPVVWSNEHVKARNVYIFMGHRAEHFQNPAFTKMFTNAIFWAANQ